MNDDGQFLGVVQAAQFRVLAPASLKGTTARLTQMHMQEARAPESGEVDLRGYEGNAVLVQGRYSGDWIYDARVISQAGPILTWVVSEVFGEGMPRTASTRR